MIHINSEIHSLTDNLLIDVTVKTIYVDHKPKKINKTRIYYYYHQHLPCKTFGTFVGEIIDRASSYWNNNDYDVYNIEIKAYAVIYTIKKCPKYIED